MASACWYDAAIRSMEKHLKEEHGLDVTLAMPALYTSKGNRMPRKKKDAVLELTVEPQELADLKGARVLVRSVKDERQGKKIDATGIEIHLPARLPAKRRDDARVRIVKHLRGAFQAAEEGLIRVDIR